MPRSQDCWLGREEGVSVGARLTGQWLIWDLRCFTSPDVPEVRLLIVEVRPAEEEFEEADKALRCSL